MEGSTLLFVVNVDWYFKLHWIARARAAKKVGFHIHIATQFTDSKILSNFHELGFITHPIKLRRGSMNPIHEYFSYKEINKTIRSVKPDLIHSITVKPNIYAGITSKSLKINQVMSVTGLGRAFSSSTFKANIARKLIIFLYRLLCSNNKVRIIFENHDDKSLFESSHISNSDNLIVIPGAGVDIDYFKYVQETPSLSPRPVVLFASRMLWDKGIKDLVNAVRLLKERGVHLQLNVAGIIDNDGVGAVVKSQIFNWHDDGDINWLGQVDDMVSVLKNSSIVVLPTTYGEGVPRILIEAAAVGRAIVATAVVGCRDIVQDGKNGILVEPHSPEEIANALESLLLSYDLRCKYGEAGRELVENNFSEEKVIAKTLRVYELAYSQKTKA